jgi:hypothetical protein
VIGGVVVAVASSSWNVLAVTPVRSAAPEPGSQSRTALAVGRRGVARTVGMAPLAGFVAERARRLHTEVSPARSLSEAPPIGDTKKKGDG